MPSRQIGQKQDRVAWSETDPRCANSTALQNPYLYIAITSKPQR